MIFCSVAMAVRTTVISVTIFLAVFLHPFHLLLTCLAHFVVPEVAFVSAIAARIGMAVEMRCGAAVGAFLHCDGGMRCVYNQCQSERSLVVVYI